MKYARIQNDIVQEVIDFDPAGRFTAEVAAMFEPVPDDVGQGDTKNPDGTFTKYVPPAPPQPAPVVTLTMTADKMEAAVNEVITVTATFDAPITATFSVPIEDGNGMVVKIKAVAFVAGAATVQLSFDKSGYYRLTQNGINRKLPADQQIVLPETFELTVFE